MFTDVLNNIYYCLNDVRKICSSLSIRVQSYPNRMATANEMFYKDIIKFKIDSIVLFMLSKMMDPPNDT